MRLLARIRRSDDRGALAIEYAILTPMFFLVFALIYVFARLTMVNGVLDSGTRDAARAATQAPNWDQAEAVARQIVRDAVGTGSSRCLATLDVTVSRNFAPGQTITVDARCTYSISDAGIPGAPGAISAHAQFSSILDPNRTVR